MPRDGSTTRTAIMDAAEGLILETGFAATSVDRVIERAGITKGTFFYHFNSKAALAQALVERYAALDLGNLDDKMTRAEKLARDPVQQLLLFVGRHRVPSSVASRAPAASMRATSRSSQCASSPSSAR